MPVRFEDDAIPTTTPQRSRPRWILALIPAVVLVVGLVGAWGRDKPKDTSQQPPADKPGVLERGEAIAGGGALKALYGVPIGYPQTLAGATSAAINYDVAGVGPGIWRGPESRQAINNYIFTKESVSQFAMSDDITHQFQRHYNFNDSGQVLNPDGSVDYSSRIYSDCYPKYGAYRIVDVQPNRNQPETVIVETWQPCVFGPGKETDTSRVIITWSGTPLTMKWVDGDWRISYLSKNQQRPASPSNLQKVNPSFAERARILGPGWLLPANATEEFDASTGIGQL